MRGSPIDTTNTGPENDSTIVCPIGHVFSGRYRIVRELGSGGFATVYYALDEKLVSKPVVVKVLNDVRGDAWAMRKFQQEMEALARIDHPGVVAVLDEGQTPRGAPFLVMQYVGGGSLCRLIHKGGMDLALAGVILRQVGIALSAAHAKGVYHRDLKPGNIMVQSAESEPLVKLIDFGIAGIKDSLFSKGDQSTRIAGTYRYMAPEQLEGKVCLESDIFALGAIAFEMLTGEPAIHSPMELIAMRLDGLRVKPRELRPQIPEAAEAVIVKALAYEASQRYSSARAVGELLAAALGSGDAKMGPTVTMAMRPPRNLAGRLETSRRGLLTGAVAVAVASAGGIFVALRKEEPPAKPSAKPSDKTSARPSDKTSAATATTQLEYSIAVKGKNGQPFQLAGEMLFPTGYDLAFNLRAPQPGFLYVLDDGPMPDGSVTVNVLYPGLKASAQLSAGEGMRIPGEGWFHLDEASGTEELYLVWSDKPVPEMESIKDLSASVENAHVVLRDRSRLAAVRQFLAGNQIAAAGIEKDEGAKKTRLSSGRGVLVHRIRLEHH